MSLTNNGTMTAKVGQEPEPEVTKNITQMEMEKVANAVIDSWGLRDLQRWAIEVIVDRYIEDIEGYFQDRIMLGLDEEE